MTATVPLALARSIYHQVGDARTRTPSELDAIATQHGLTLEELAAVCKRVSVQRKRGSAPLIRVPEVADSDAKACSKCGVMQPLSEYHANPGTRDGKSSQCRKCNSKRKPTVSRIIRTRARGRAMFRLIELHRAEFEGLLEEETEKAAAEHAEVQVEAEKRGQVDAPVARLKSGPKRRGQTSALERLDVARCPKCHRFHDAGHQVDACESEAS